MLNDFVEVFGFRPGSLNPLLAKGGFVGGVEKDLVSMKIRAMMDASQQAEEEAKGAQDDKAKFFWLGVLESVKADTHHAKTLARHFEFD